MRHPPLAALALLLSLPLPDLAAASDGPAIRAIEAEPVAPIALQPSPPIPEGQLASERLSAVAEDVRQWLLSQEPVDRGIFSPGQGEQVLAQSPQDLAAPPASPVRRQTLATPIEGATDSRPIIRAILAPEPPPAPALSARVATGPTPVVCAWPRTCPTPRTRPASRRAASVDTLRYASSSHLNLKAYEREIHAAAAAFGINPDLIRAVIHAESSFNPSARSHVGAQGLMQLMPATAARFGVSDPFEPSQNIWGGTRYLAWLLRRFGGDSRLATAAFNAGENAVDRHGGIPPYRETINYVEKVSTLFRRYQQARNP